MSDFAELVSELVQPPGDASPATERLLARAAAVHAQLLHRLANSKRSTGFVAAMILHRLRRLPGDLSRESLLCDPLLIAGLHRLSRMSSDVAAWHRAVAAPSMADVAARDLPASGASLGQVALALHLLGDSSWRGRVVLETDVFGRIEFPRSDWLLRLSRPRDGPRGLMPFRRVVVEAGPRLTRWFLDDSRSPPVLEMSRDDLLRMLPLNDEGLTAEEMSFPHPDIRPALVCKSCIPGTPVRYDPVLFENFTEHAPVTGGVVAAVIEALGRASPGMALEFGRLIRGVRAFEFPSLPAGTIQSFSDPAMPGVMSLNMPFTEQHEPRICPFCFCWFGHELGHTKSYLIETIAHAHGNDFLRNPQHQTSYVPRYGRPLRVRTLLQVPYTHLYEWQLMADFLQSGFRDLPWSVESDPVAAVNDLALEIEESFALIDRHADLTRSGRILVEHLENLRKAMVRRWDRVVSTVRGQAVVHGTP